MASRNYGCLIIRKLAYSEPAKLPRLFRLSAIVAFIMKGDHNDGYAQFFVDDTEVGVFDLYHLERAILAVTGLELVMHSLKVMQFGYHNPASTKADVAIFGGAAFNVVTSTTEIIEPPVWVLFLTGFLYFIGRRVPSSNDHRAA